jgi:hypothetical protein
MGAVSLSPSRESQSVNDLLSIDARATRCLRNFAFEAVPSLYDLALRLHV